jgi:Family of unknown function (DUF7033)
VLKVECGTNHAPERRYALDVVLRDFLGLEFELRVREGVRDVTITSGGRQVVVADVLFAENSSLLDVAALPSAKLDWCSTAELPGVLIEGDVPVLYGRAIGPGVYLEVGTQTVQLGIDVFGAVFVLLTRLEEIVSRERDQHDRFPASASILVRNGLAQRPLADEYVEVLWLALNRLWPGLERKCHPFSVRPTHDVDWPFYSRGKPLETFRQAASDVATRRNRALAVARFRSLAAIMRSGRGADPCNTFDFLMDASEQHGVRSAFYFMGGRSDSVHDAGYPLDEWVRGVIRRIDQRGHEIGVHPSYRTFDDLEALRREVKTVSDVAAEAGVEAPVAGGRQHFLRWENPATWRNWNSVGLRYDSTLGYSELCGFRCGTSRAFPVFDLELRTPLGLVEQPLIAMEAALLSHQHLSFDDAVVQMGELKEVCRRTGGTFTFLWHNNRLSSPAEREAYTSVLA